MRAESGLTIALAALAALAAGTPSAGAQDEVAAIDLGGLDTRSAALMLSAQEAGDLEVRALAIPLPDPGGGGRSRMTLVVEIGGASLIEAVPPEAGELITEVYGYAVDAEGALAANLTRAFRLDLERLRPRLAAGGVKFFGGFELAPGDYSVRVLVLQRSSGRLGLRILSATAPAWGSEAVLLPPVRREPPDGWILVNPAGHTPAFPLTVGGQAWVPSTRDSVDAGARADLLLLGRGLGAGLRAHLLAAGGEVLAEVGLGDLRSADGGPAGLEALAAELDAAALDAGDYRLRVQVAETTASAPLVVRPAGGALPEAAAAPTGLKARESRGRQAGLERLDQVRAAYARAFERLASGDRQGALEPLIEVETARVGSDSLAEQKRLAQAQFDVAWEVASPDPELLLTAIRLHEGLYRRYHRERRFLLATHSRLLIRSLAKLYDERSRSPDASHLVACALVSLAGYLQQSRALPAADDAYHEALDYDPDHPAALIGLAAIQESYGRYDRAVVLLQRLSKQSPADTQVQLRLGVNLKRLDKPKRAFEHLEAAFAEPGPAWVAAVAAQELAGLHADEGRLDDAIRVLEEASAAHGDVQRLKLQLAALLDRAGRRSDAVAVLAYLDPTAGSGTSSPRLIYSRAPTAAIAAARRVLDDVTDRRLAARGAVRAAEESAPVPGGGS